MKLLSEFLSIEVKKMVMDLIKQVKKNTRLLMHHIGLGGDAHIPVNSVNAGFMTPDQKTALETAVEDSKNARGAVTLMKNGTDILTLPAGNYKITGALNNPISPTDASVILYTVMEADQGRKYISAVLTSVGLEFYRTTHTGGAPTSGTGGWRLVKPRRLWGGSLQSGSATFADTQDDSLVLTGFTIWYMTDTGQSDCVSFISNTGGATSICVTNLPNDNSDGLQIYECRVSVTRTGFSVDANFGCIVTATGPHYSADKFVSIIRIEAF